MWISIYLFEKVQEIMDYPEYVSDVANGLRKVQKYKCYTSDTFNGMWKISSMIKKKFYSSGNCVVTLLGLKGHLQMAGLYTGSFNFQPKTVNTEAKLQKQFWYSFSWECLVSDSVWWFIFPLKSQPLVFFTSTCFQIFFHKAPSHNRSLQSVIKAFLLLFWFHFAIILPDINS